MNNMQQSQQQMHPGESISVWMDHAKRPLFSALNKNIVVDVCVIGGGIAGLTAAYFLQQEGKKVCVLEDLQIASGQTGKSTAHATYALDSRYFEIEKYHGQEGARRAAESHKAALSLIQEIVAKEKIDCDLEVVDGYLFVPLGDSQGLLDHELAALHRAGLTEVSLEARAPLASFETGPALRFPKQLKLNPVKYCNGLAESLFENEGEVYIHTHVDEIHGGENAYVKTSDGYTVSCNDIVVATNSPINDRVTMHTKQASYRTYVIGIKVPKGTLDKNLYWDTEDPYHYLRAESADTENEEMLFVGGEDHKTGQNKHDNDYYKNLEEWARLRFNRAGEVVYRWSGQVMESIDGLAYIGRNPSGAKNVYIITGHSGNGMTYSTLGGFLVCDQIVGHFNSWETLYDPARISLRAATHFFKENANMVAQYRDWLTEKSFSEFKDIAEGEGIVFRDGLKIIAAYKDHSGNMEYHSAVCPHLGGLVRWNSVEKSWDCPCHGSRFDCHGKVIEGPAFKDLKPIVLDAPTPHVEFLRIETDPRPFIF